MAEDDGPVGPEPRRRVGKEPRLRLERGALRVDPVGVAEARAVDHDHPVARGEPSRERMGEIPCVAAGAVDEDEVGPFAHDHVMHPVPVDRQESPSGGHVASACRSWRAAFQIVTPVKAASARRSQRSSFTVPT
jgi:hypothetical protein